jgi:hypothetical protein
MYYLLRLWNKAVGREKNFAGTKHGSKINALKSLDVGDYIVAYTKAERKSIHRAAYAAYGGGHIKTKLNKEVGGWICTRVK